MKTRIMCYLILAQLFVGNSYAIDEIKKPSDIDTPGGYSKTIGEQGYEGIPNTFFGYLAGSSTSGWNNAFFGYCAGCSNTTAEKNSFFGDSVGKFNTTGHSNAFFGYAAGVSNTTADNNSFFGNEAGYSNTTGYENTFIGSDAGNKNKDGYRNTFVGTNAGLENINAYDNTFVGMNAGYSNTIGIQNTFLGRAAGYANKSGQYNTFVGYAAGNKNSEGKGNVFFGYKAGFYETGSDRLYIDNSETARPLIWGDFETNKIVIHGGFRAASSYISSDVRWKKNIELLESSLEKISSLQGVIYEWKINEYPDFGLTEGKQIGLIAQNVEKKLPELVSEDKDGYKSVSYSKLTAVLVEAVKELKAENEVLRAENRVLKQDVEKIKAVLGM